MGNKLQSIFNPTPEELKERFRQYKRIHDDLKAQKSCVTCENAKHVISYPGFVTAEEYECTAGYECDTVLDTVTNCPGWKDDWGNIAKKIFCGG